MPRKQLATTANKTSAKSVRSKFWFLRVDGEESFLRQQCGVMASGLDVVSFIGAYHTGRTGENHHIHACIEIESEVQKQTFALRVKAIFTNIIEGNDYSLEVWDGKKSGEGAVSYLFHEEGVVESNLIGVKNFTSDEISGAKKANMAVQAVVAINKERASNKLVDKALEFFDNQEPTRYSILLFMMKRINSGDNYHPGNFLLKKYVEEVELRLCKTDREIEELAKIVEENLWR